MLRIIRGDEVGALRLALAKMDGRPASVAFPLLWQTGSGVWLDPL